MMGRSKEKLEKAAEGVQKAAKEGADARNKGKAGAPEAVPNISIEVCDLSSQKSTRAAAARVVASYPSGIDILVNNAGVMAIPDRRETEDGFELQMATNHYGHFTLTSLLLPLLAKRPGARVVNVSSIYHTQGNTTKLGINLDDMHATKKYDRWMQYRCTKAANAFFTNELQRRLEAANLSGPAGITAVTCHPGYSATNLQREVTGATIANALVAQSQYMGCLPTLMAATGDVPAASYVGPPGMSGYPVVGEPDARTRDEGTMKALWEHSVVATKTTWDMLGGGSGGAAVAGAEAGTAAAGGGGEARQ